jgi:phage replication O-like protein O
MGEPARQIQITEPFTATPNRILDKLIEYPLPPTHQRLVLWIIRATYGWHKPTVDRDLCAISKALGIDKTAACRAIRALIDKNVIIQDGREIAVNPNVDAWGNTDADQEPTEPTVDNSVKIEAESGGATFYSFKEKNNHPPTHVASPRKLKDRIRGALGGDQKAAKKAVDRIPEADRNRCKGLVVRYIRRMGAEYVERALDYVEFRKPDHFGRYLACCLNEGWGEEWAKQRTEAAEIERKRQEAADRKRAEVEAENKRIEASNREYEAQRERVFSMPADELERLEADFVGGLGGLRLKRYRKRGLSAVESEFVSYVEKVLTQSKDE